MWPPGCGPASRRSQDGSSTYRMSNGRGSLAHNAIRVPERADPLGVGRAATRADRDTGRHRDRVVDAGLVDLERRGHGEDRLAVLDRHHPPGGERPAVPGPVDLEDDRHLGIARPQEVAVQRMHPRGRPARSGRPPSTPARPPGRRTPAPATGPARRPRNRLSSSRSRSSRASRSSSTAWPRGTPSVSSSTARHTYRVAQSGQSAARSGAPGSGWSTRRCSAASRRRSPRCRRRCTRGPGQHGGVDLSDHLVGGVHRGDQEASRPPRSAPAGCGGLLRR